MHSINFISWLKKTFGDAWMQTYKSNPSSFQQMYYMQFNLSAEIPFEDAFANINRELIAELVTVDTVSQSTQLIYNGAFYKTDAQLMKLATKINEIIGIDLTELRTIFANMINASKNRNPTFDKSVILHEIDDIFVSENIILDIAKNEFVRIIGKDNNNADITATLSPTEIITIVKVNQDAKKINTDNAIDSKILLNMLDYHKIETRKNHLEELIKTIKYNANCNYADEYIARLHDAMKIKEDISIFKMLIKHFVWQIKRRIMERNTYNDIMISFFGNQGIGKSYVVNNIFGKILNNFYNSDISLDNLMDERWTLTLNTQFLLNIEEMDSGRMGNISGKNLATIKKIITGSEATYRPMGTNTIQSVKIKTSFISNANFHIYDIINDESGMRRFFEFNSAIEKGCRIDAEKVAALIADAEMLFRSIDEDESRGYWDINSATGKEIAIIQDSYVKKPAIDEFANMFELADLKYSDCIPLDMLYDNYSAFCENQGVNIKFRTIKKNFRRKMEDLINNCVKTHANVHKFSLILKSEKVEELNANIFAEFGDEI